MAVGSLQVKILKSETSGAVVPHRSKSTIWEMLPDKFSNCCDAGPFALPAVLEIREGDQVSECWGGANYSK
jgi:hypothetical protein